MDGYFFAANHFDVFLDAAFIATLQHPVTRVISQYFHGLNDAAWTAWCRRDLASGPMDMVMNKVSGRRGDASASEAAHGQQARTGTILAAMRREFDHSYFRSCYPALCAKSKHTKTDLFDLYIATVGSLACDPSPDFSEQWYLMHNPDVSLAVTEGTLRCGFEHWVRFGRAEGRVSALSNPYAIPTVIGPAHLDAMRQDFDARFARLTYPPALELSAAMSYELIFQMYLRNVRDLLLDPNDWFSERYYLERNPDVRASVKVGTHHCGFHHWIASGCTENRVHSPPEAQGDVVMPRRIDPVEARDAFAALFDAPFYCDRYPDPDGTRDPFDRFMSDGLACGHVPVPPERFDEEFYLSYYSDVKLARQRGVLPSGYFHYVLAGCGEGRSPTYDAGHLLAAKLGDAAEPVGLANVHMLADRMKPLGVDIDNSRPATVNVFVPTLDPDLMFGGYIAFLHFLCRLSEAGYRIRLLIMQDQYCNRDWLLRNIANRPRWLAALQEGEFVNCTRKSASIACNSNDVCVAYSTWTMHDAWSVASRLTKREVLFFIQEYEPIFHENGAAQFVSASAYSLPHFAIFNSKLLQNYFLHNRIGVFTRASLGRFMTFQHALAAVSPDPTVMQTGSRHRRFVCYARPEKHAGRNLFEICVLATRAALAQGIFPGQWTFHGIGSLGRGYDIDLGGDQTMHVTARIPQDEYEAHLNSFDVGLSLMWSPHPSIIPFELARAGVVTVTNEYGIRDGTKLAKFGYNIVSAFPTIDGIVAALRVAVRRSADVQARVRAAAFDWPTDWDRVFSNRFIANVARRFGIPDACKRREHGSEGVERG